MIIEFVTLIQYQLAFTTLEEYLKVQIILRGSIIIATETYFERVGGAESGVLVTWQEWCETLWSKSTIFVNKSCIYSFNISEFVFLLLLFL